MTHRMRVGQAVVPAQDGEGGASRVYHVVQRIRSALQLVPHYRIRCSARGVEHVVREDEIRAAFR
jgi:hypothetical protein